MLPELEEVFDSQDLFDYTTQFKVVRKEMIFNRLLIRLAREEDQDNLAEICNRQTEIQTSIFGDFFLSEIISSRSNDKICLVAENQEKKAVGLLVASKEVNYDVIVKNYNLEVYQYFTKGGYFESYQQLIQISDKIKTYKAKLEREKEDKIIAFNKNIYSKTFLIVQLQEFCVQIQAESEKLFASFQNLFENKKILTKNILLTKFEKLFKKHEIAIPHARYAQEADVHMETCIMTPLELLFESLGYFDLEKGYLDGVGHWDGWLQRKIDSQNKEQETKGLVGQKKRLNKKKLKKEKEI